MSSESVLQELKDLFANSKSTVNEDHGSWLGPVRDKLYTMLCSPMKEEYIHEAFKWISQLCISWEDLSWISPEGLWTTEEAKMFSCIARLSMTEIHILIPLIQRHLTLGDEPDIENGQILARSALSDDYDRFGDHLVILESVIKSLVKGQQIEDDIEDENALTNSLQADLKILLERLKETISLICDYLELIHRHWHELKVNQESEKFHSAEAALRIISVWLSEDPSGFEQQCKRFLIDLLIENLLIDKQTKNDLLITALHSVCTSNDELSIELKRHPTYKNALEKYLSYVQSERDDCKTNDRHNQKLFKLRCGLVKDLMVKTR